MSVHKLERRRHTIDALADLGKVLGYTVEREHPVGHRPGPNSPAVDVAWFAEAGQTFPLMIFEVESSATNSMANNPLKVLGQDTATFEKPLFFFHIVVSGGSSSERIDTLRRQYGTYNYRLYRLSHREGTTLLFDILSQHRRIHETLDYNTLYTCLKASWQGDGDIAQVIRHASGLGFDGVDLSTELQSKFAPPRSRLPTRRLAALIGLAQKDDALLPEVFRIIDEDAAQGWRSASYLPSNIGRAGWAALVLTALMNGVNAGEAAAEWDRRFLLWQERIDAPLIYPPHLGLTDQYDEFIIGLAAPLLTLCVAVANDAALFPARFCQALADMIDRLDPIEWEGLQLAIWLCHLSAYLSLSKPFEAACTFIAKCGGVTRRSLLNPPSVVHLDDRADRTDFFPPGRVLTVSTMSAFKRLVRRHFLSTSPMSPISLALRAVGDNMFMYAWTEHILTLLWSRSDLSGGRPTPLTS